jgi:hypothetical protein
LNNILILILFFFLLCLTARGQNLDQEFAPPQAIWVEGPAPQEDTTLKAENELVNPKISKNGGTVELFVQLNFSIPQLEDELNEVIASNYQDHKNKDLTDLLKDDWFEYRLARGRFAIQVLPGKILWSAPISGSFTAGGKFVGIKTRSTAEFNGRLSGVMTADINAQWKLLSNTQLSVDVDNAEIKMIDDKIHIHVAHKLEEELRDKVLPKIEQSIQKKLAPKLTPEKAENAWNKLHQRKILSYNPEIWLAVTPQSFTVRALRPIPLQQEAPGSGPGPWASIGLGLKTSFTFYLEERPTLPEKTPLPPLQKLPADHQESFKLNLPVVVPYTLIAERLNYDLRWQEYLLDKALYTVTNILLLRNDGRLVFVLETQKKDGGEKKKWTIAARPRLEDEHLRWIDETPQFFNETQNDPEALGREVLLAAINKAGVFQLPEHFDRARQEILKGVEKIAQDAEVKIDFRIEKIQAQALSLKPQYVILTSTLSGQVALEIRDLNLAHDKK